MMKLLRLINPLYTLRLERENVAMHEQMAAMKRGMLQYIDVGGRQLPPDTAAALLRKAILAQNDAGVARMAIMAALKDMRNGRLDAARAELEAILGEAHAEPAPIHIVDRVA